MFHRPVAGAKIPYPKARKNELEGTRAVSSAQIVHAVNLHYFHFNNLRKKFHPFTLFKRVKTKYNTISGA
jgi:hypothetical protein